MNNAIETKCQHVLLANGIHEFTLKEWGMSGTDAFMTQLEHLYNDYESPDKTLPIVVVNGSGALPINYSMQRGKELISQHSDIRMVRIAVISDSSFEARLVDSFMRLLRFPNIRMRFFEVARRAAAEKWLLEEN